jgi:hypothetical protein
VACNESGGIAFAVHIEDFLQQKEIGMAQARSPVERSQDFAGVGFSRYVQRNNR